jgi:hypothetical protein
MDAAEDAFQLNRTRDAISPLQEAVTTLHAPEARRAGPDRLLVAALGLLGLALTAEGCRDEARDVLDEATLVISQEGFLRHGSVRDLSLACGVLVQLGILNERANDVDRARALVQNVLTIIDTGGVVGPVVTSYKRAAEVMLARLDTK